MAEGRRALTLPSLPARPVSNRSRLGAMAADAAPIRVGVWLRFKFPNGRRFAHRFWTGHPGDPRSRLVLASESFVNLQASIGVREVQTAVLGETEFVAVRFRNANDGMMLWTNYSRNGRVWMWRMWNRRSSLPSIPERNQGQT